MAEISSQTLMMALQALNSEIDGLRSTARQIEDMAPDDQELMLAFSQAEMELKSAYLEARRANPNLPPYDGAVSALR